jgi:hypothetical protein
VGIGATMLIDRYFGTYQRSGSPPMEPLKPKYPSIGPLKAFVYGPSSDWMIDYDLPSSDMPPTLGAFATVTLDTLTAAHVGI